MQILTFQLDDHIYGLPAIDTVEVVRAVRMATVNDSLGKSGIDGVFDFRGTLVALIDIRKKFGLPTRPIKTSDHFIIVKLANIISEAEIAAFRVDHAIGLIDIEIEKFNSVQKESNFLGVARFDSDLIVIYDINMLLQGVDFSTLLN